MNEIEELYQLLQGKVKTGTLEEFTQRMQDPKSLAAVKKYAQEKIKPSTNTNLQKFNEGFSVKPATQQPVQEPTPQKAETPVKVGVQAPKAGEFRLPTEQEMPTTSGKEKILTGLEAVPISELQAKRKAADERLKAMGQQFDDQAFNELTTKATALQKELQSLIPAVESGSAKQKSAFATAQASLKEKEAELQQIASKLDAAKPLEAELKLLADQHKAAKTPEQANAIAAAYNKKLGEYTAATSGATKEYNEKLASYTEQVKQANVEVAKLSPAALTRYNAIIRELKTIENDPVMAKRSQMSDEYNALVKEAEKLGTELKNRMPDGPLQQFTETSPAYRADRRRIIFEKLTPEQRAKELSSSLSLSENSYNPQGEVTAKLNGFESYEEMRLATTAGLAAADLKQKPVPLTKEQVEAMNAFIQENYADMPATSIAELEAHLSDMATTSPNNFWRTVRQNTTGTPISGAVNSIISSPVTGVLGMVDSEGTDVKESTKARILEEAYASKLKKVKSRMSDLEVAIDSDPVLLEEYRTFAQSSAIISELQDKQRTPEEDQKLDEAFTAIGNLQTSEMKEYAALMQQYKSDYKNLSNVIKYYPEELARRTLLSLKNNQTVINDNDSMVVKAAKQLDAIKGAATNTALRIGGNTLKTLTTLGDRIDRAVTGEEYTSATERYFEETGKFLESAIFLPELPEDMRSTIAQDLMGNSKIRGQAVLPGIATGIVQMGALIYGARGMTGALGGGLIGSSRALTASGFVFEFNDIYESFLDAGLSSREALGYAAGISYVVARAEGFSPQGVGISFFDQSVKKAITKLAKTGAKDFGTAFSQGSLHILKELGTENLQEFTQDGLKTIGNYLINKGYGTDLDGSFEAPQIAETALITTGTTLVFSLLNGKSQIRGEAYSAAQYLAEKPEQLEAELQRRVSEGKMDMDMARGIFRYVTKVKETVDANKAKEAFDKKIEGYTPQKPMVEDYEGPTEITLDEYFAADNKVPTGVIVNWDGKKYEVRTDDKGTTLTLMEEVVEEQPEGESTEVAPQVELKPTKQKLTVEEFNELVQAPQGERVETELENAQVAEYQGKEYKITETQGDQVVLENYAGTARMTVPASEVKPFAVAPLATITIEGQQFKADQKQQQALQLIDQVEQDQIEKINSSNLTDVQKKSQTKAIQEAFKRSRKEILGVKEELKTGQEVYFGGKKVKVKSLTKNTAKVEIDGVVTTVSRSSLSLSDTTPLDEAAAQLKQRGHVFTLHAGKPMSKQDTDAYMKTDSKTAKIVGRVKQLLPVLAKSGIKIKVFSDVQSAEEAALELGADPRAVRGIRHDGKEVLAEEYLGNGISHVTYEDGTTANVPQVEIQYTTFNGFFDPKTNTIILNAQVAAASTVEHEFLHPIIESILIDNPEIVTTFFEQIKKMPEWADLKDFVEQYDAKEQPIEALIEFTARIIAPEFKYQTRRPTFKRAVVDFFRRIFRIAGPIVNINSKNVLDFAESLKKSFELGRTFDIKDTDGGFSIRAYHGTPHDFDKFTTEKIGTGEGAQAFGWGLYFTELEDIARYYADKLTKPQFSFNGEVITDEYVNTFLSNNLSSNGNITAGTIKYALQEAQEDYAENSEAAVKRAISTLEGMIGGEVSKVPNRNLYTVTLHEGKSPDEYTWLEWDKPVSDAVKELLFRNVKEASLSGEIHDIEISDRYDAESFDGGKTYRVLDVSRVGEADAVGGTSFATLQDALVEATRLNFLDTKIKGREAYEALSKEIGAKAASLFLLEAGIDGVKYPAESLSGKEARGSNYVVFDENAVTVNEKIRFSKATLAPNGKPSTLTPEQYEQVRTPEFKAWFGDWENDPENSSKVVDENGEPRVVFHGTRNKDLTVLDPSKGLNIDAVYHTKDVEVASHWSGTTRVRNITDDDISKLRSLDNLEDVLGHAGNVMSEEYSVEENYITQEEAKMFGVKPGYFYTLVTPSGSSPLGSLRGPKKASDSATLDAVKREILQTLEFYKSYEAANYGKNYANYLNIRNPLIIDAKGRSYHQIKYKGRTMNTESIASEAAQSNYDGVIVENVLETDYENYKTTDYISFEPTQIKSATSNVGTFDSSNPDIRFSKATSSKFSKALTIPEMELSFDKFRDLALLWKAYNPTKSEADFYEYVRANVDKRVNKGFMSAAFNDDATYLQKRKDAELDTRSKNLNAQSRGTLGYMADPNVPQFIKDRLKTEQLRYETEPNSVTEKTVDYIIQNYDLSNAEAVLESIQVPAVRTRLADKLIDRLNKLGRDAATAEEKTEYYYAALKLTENNIHYMRSLGRGIQIHSQYSKMDKEGIAFAVNQMMKINRSGLKKAHKTAIDRMVAYARLVERGQRKALITDEVKTQVLSGGKTKEQIRNLKESAAKKLRAIGAQGFSVAPDRQSLLDYGYYEFLDGRRSKASWVKHMTDRGLSDAADVYDYHNFGTAQNPETLADFSDRVESLSDLIGTPALAQAIGQPLADKINAEHRKRVVSALRDKYKKDLKKKGIAGQMAAALITAVEKGQYDSDVLLDELAKTVGAVELTQDDIKIIDEIYKRAATYPEGRIRDEELAKAWDYIYARSRDSLKYGEMYWSFFYANILSGPGTHALNLIENALNIVLEPTVQIADQITRVNTQGLSRRTVAWNMASGVLRGLFGAGVREGLSVVVTGKEKFRGANKYFDSNALEQIAKGTAGKGLLTTILRPAATVMRYVPRALAAADAFYNQAHFEMGNATVAAQIVRQEVDTKVIDKKDAKARYYEILGDSSWWVTALRDAEIEIKEAYRLQGKELTNDFDTWYKIKTRAREIVLNKRQEAASKYVYNDIGGASSDMAAIGTYTNAPRGVLGAVATHAAGLVADVPIARHVIPFVNIVANVYNRQLDYTPWGLARAAAILTKGGKSDFIAEGREKYSWNTHEGAAKQHIIKSVMGTAAMIAAYLLFWDDDDNVFTDEEAFTIHGRGPTDYAKKKEMEARGWKPYSFQYKGKFYAFNWTPFNLALSFIANAIDKQRYGKNDEDKSALDNTLIAFNLLGSTLLSAAFVKSAADFLSFFQEGKEESDRLWNFLGRTAISSAPAPMALFNTIHSTVDNTKYQADSVSQGILRNIPIAKTQLKPALNAFGEVITKTGISQDMTWYRVGELTGLNRFMSALDTNDTTFAWLHQNGLWPPVIGKTKELFGNKVSDETHYKLVEICGPNIKRMIEFDKAYIDKLIAEDGVAEANKYINQKLKNRIVDFVEDAIIDQYNFKPDEETIIELKDVDWEKVRKYVTDATNEMMVPVE